MDEAPDRPELARMLQERGEELLLLQARLIEQERLAGLGGLVAGFAHEISTPIGVAVTAASGLEEYALQLQTRLGGERLTRAELQALAAKLVQTARFTNTHLQRASDLLGSFRTLAEDCGHVKVQAVNLPDYLRRLVRAHAPALKTAQVQVDIDAPEHVPAVMAVGLLAQLVSILLLNAVSHAFEGRRERRIAIHLRAEGERLCLQLRDNGRGLAPAQRAHVFEPFYTGQRGSGGRGLGLNIVMNLCQRLGGTVRLDEAPGPGLGFIIELPLNSSAPS
ncbi:sensor histidine kinase [Paucibacter soli]|uniref:sensor histidine kinase n=1 Tax=Paucibacter soli TaxID=3133433 RepID=UPI003095D432